ncbi:MAG: UDP-N-acetylmuramoylalanyl-D-glutamyl-2,6-diaminopimelate--D-alanyl-D-alanine ligase [Roseitalea sp.]|jgi:UDP-N-acetylmuramoyl-tripeptide--D-alanyl-D-alanine ligase|nr:UDP-N-acetylmuramoylalanyl-D-glutamyl-2,6-diaminopimelate--D-alanyl-D-alanine ligase [Roseitalea sp.]MBO6722314.1 UDP-N-acetylmuramoylalanyl-D-glutamyl-2,6-diaminopimelate--D-alanyl-D-alanine ligase [Roseitalea sp.]MBO6742356.1 UDP-N-acetylmuramoylalanyl-D-glutamyl-2,6-diaminopimelate--D-alanyl-D-alanine ligase [Roseitalea sp.]
MSADTQTSPLWTGQDMLDAMDGRPVNGVADAVTGISIDTRTLQPGDAFFAIQGDVHDGHAFASKAVAAGASCLVVQEGKLAALGGVTLPLVVVPDVLDGLSLLGRAARARTKARIIAVTGSAGKTTTKDALRHVLGRCGKVHASVASYNNHWGVPLTLARMPADADHGVFEIGMNHAGEITPLVKLVRPHIGMITLIAAAHLGNFKNLDGIAHAKAEIFSGVVRGGTALINRDDKRFKLLADLAGQAGINKVIGYGADKKADARLVKAKYHADCSCVTAMLFGEEIAFKVGLPGRHVVQNMLGVLAACHLMGADMTTVAHALAELQAPDGRGRQYTFEAGEGPFTLIDESYNANPASVAAALELLAALEPKPGGRRIAVLGDMLELGSHSARLHKGLAGPVGKAGLDRLYLAGDEMRALAGAVGEDGPVTDHFDDVDTLGAALRRDVSAGDVVMIKSSNGIGFSRLVSMFENAKPRA